ncbi:SLC44A2 isoform 12 [Pan troglodytes]|uniref:Solute carrier family 44 member 2 (CTL2 blood group) n=3 Tax=Hominidae TaxID=9604 RepID=K7EMR2_HUMAN|nr:SLC44A2 isoform 12 [Pan troglodytes]PNJ14421.1 SLC44A2 isoform 13 [Pongo abelii]
MGDERPHYYGKHGTPQKYDPTFKGPIYNSLDSWRPSKGDLPH